MAVLPGNTVLAVINVAWYILMSYADVGCFRREFQP